MSNKYDFAPLVRLMDSLAGRWADEREYEDFTDYQRSVKACLYAIAPAIDVKLTKKFKLTFALDGQTHEIKVTTRAVTHNVYEVQQ